LEKTSSKEFVGQGLALALKFTRTVVRLQDYFFIVGMVAGRNLRFYGHISDFAPQANA
jgi:hypothetical protein